VVLAMAATGESAEFARLVRAQLPGADRLAGFLLGDAAEAEDAIQDAMEKAWFAWAEAPRSGRFGAWSTGSSPTSATTDCASRGKHRVLRLRPITIAGQQCSADAVPRRPAVARAMNPRSRLDSEPPARSTDRRLGSASGRGAMSLTDRRSVGGLPPVTGSRSEAPYAIALALRQQLDRRPETVRQ